MIKFNKYIKFGWQGCPPYGASTLTDGTKPRWTIDIPMEFVGKNGKKNLY